jgi:nicotinamide riboside kinase
MTTIISLYGGPGTGKSTSSAYLFYKLKSMGLSTELVREYVKNWAWEGRHIEKYDQMYFMGKQIRAESLLFGKVDYVVTDSPVMLGAYYAELYTTPVIAAGVLSGVQAFYKQALDDGHKHLHVFLERTKPYVQAGRYETAKQAKDVDSGVKNMLEDLGIGFSAYKTDEYSLSRLLLDAVTPATTTPAAPRQKKNKKKAIRR